MGKQLGPTTYQVATPGQPHSTQNLLHVSLLKRWAEALERKEVQLTTAVEEEMAVDDQYLPSSAYMEPDLRHLSVEKNQSKSGESFTESLNISSVSRLHEWYYTFLQ